MLTLIFLLLGAITIYLVYGIIGMQLDMKYIGPVYQYVSEKAQSDNPGNPSGALRQFREWQSTRDYKIASRPGGFWFLYHHRGYKPGHTASVTSLDA